MKTTPKVTNFDILKQPNQMLTDTEINAAQILLKKQFPNIPGLQDTVLGSKLQFQ